MSAPRWDDYVERTTGSAIDVLLVDDDRRYLELVAIELDRDERLAVTTESNPTDALDRVDEADCVVSDHSMPKTTGLELLEAIRERDPSLPFVLHSGEPPAAVVGSLLDHEWTDYQRKGGGSETFALLARRLRRLVDHRRATAALRRATAGLEAARDGIALVDPDGTVAFANRRYATVLGADREAVIGSHWRERYSDDEADRLAADAIPTAADGWRWTGTCVGRDDAVEAQTSLVGLDDGSLVFVVDTDPVEDEPAASGTGTADREPDSGSGTESGPEDR